MLEPRPRKAPPQAPSAFTWATNSPKPPARSGTAKAIGKIKPGDKIKNAVPALEGKTQTHQVSVVITTPDDHDFIDLTTTSGTSQRGPPTTARLTTTTHHPFYSITQQSWVNASNLHPGDQLQQDNGTRATVETVTPYHATGITTYDLTINTLHTYYVLAGAAPVLVHNCGPGASQVPTRLWRAGGSHADDTPQDWIPMNSWIRSGGNLSEGNHTFVVMPGGLVRAFHESLWDIAEGAGHTSLSRGNPVAMAGTFDVDASGAIVRFDNFSGHYRPNGEGLEAIARDALSRNGFDVSRAVWEPFNFM